MAQPKKRRGHRPAALKSKAGAAKKTGPSNSLPHRKGPFDDDWQKFVDDVEEAIEGSVKASKKGAKLCPYDDPVSVMKRLTYDFVRKHIGRVQDIHIETAIENYRKKLRLTQMGRNHKLRKIRKPFKENRFRWALLALKDHFSIKDCFIDDDFDFEKHDVTRFSQQLLYAHRHEVPTHFLIGFLYQSGTLRDVCKKSNDESEFEPWFDGKRA